MKLLKDAKIGEKLRIEKVLFNKKISDFLFSIGCFEGEYIHIISKICNTLVLNIKDSRYALDEELSNFIYVSTEEGE